jgi:hypothetical protein
MSKIVCHAHCPPGGGPFLAVLAAGAGAVLLVLAGVLAFMARFGSVIVAAGFAVLAAAIAAGVVIVLRDRPRPAIPARAVPALAIAPARRPAAISAPRLRAIEAPRPDLYGLTSEHPARVEENPCSPSSS